MVYAIKGTKHIQGDGCVKGIHYVSKNLPLLVLSKAAVKIQVLVPYTENRAREHYVK